MNVTITGADDAVDPSDLLRLSEEFPFVEWGILQSPKRLGTPRYPSDGWVAGWHRAVKNASVRVQWAFHLCGGAARSTVLGGEGWLHPTPQRAQINGYVPGGCAARGVSGLVALSDAFGVEFILQCRHVGDIQAIAHDSQQIPRASVLFDASGGCGKSPATWPRRPFGTRFGWAGGIGPDNVDDVISELHCADMSVMHDSHAWIDMESGVRTDDRLDLVKVRRVLECVARRS